MLCHPASTAGSLDAGACRWLGAGHALSAKRHVHTASLRRPPSCSLTARWCIDIRYGKKVEALGLLQEWVRDVGRQAGLSSDNCRIYSGAVGVAESRLELEVGFVSLAQLEQFWANIPAQEHVAWSQRVREHIIDGSPKWEVYRDCPVLPSTSPDLESTTTAPKGSGMRINLDNLKPKPVPPPPIPDSVETLGSGLLAVNGQDDANVILDWKGDPMSINPGDKLPFF